MGALEKVLYVLDLIAGFVLTRFPYVCILTLLLQAGQERMRQPDTWIETMLEPTYVHAMIYFVCGGGMTVDATRRAAGFAAAVHTGYFAAMSLIRPRFSQWIMIKVFARNIALAGGYLLVAGGLVEGRNMSNLRPSLLQLGRQMQAFYAIFNGYLLWASPADKAVHISHLPLGKPVTICLTILFILCGIMLYGGLQVAYFSRLIAWMLVIVTVFVEFDTKYWGIRGVRYWDQVLIGSQNICAIANLIILGRIRVW
ncbi:uncharacterized protein LOC114523170 [Dendronephthya gigantea]|uniref:uncharacterized protein LOC114523170 n=1 Tax=Dendronephthya gigantea TaxID=151771 RepID=UPI00106A8B5C|nr:uncharacterized protein LOC114523170 [Dendronephthya gigantea]